MARPLEGLRVLELGGDVAVRYCGRLFAVLGAEVCRQDAPDDVAIGWGGDLGKAYGQWLDAGKHPWPDASAEADIVIAGLDETSLDKARAAQGRSVLVEITWFDPGGPYRGWNGSDEVIAALSGGAFLFGEAEGPPMLPQGHGPQLTAGLTAFIAGLAASMEHSADRRRRVAVNVLEAAMCYSENGALGAQQTSAVTPRVGVNRFVPTYPSGPYPTLDGWVGVTCLTPAQWRALCRLIGRDDLAADERFSTAYKRLLIGDEVDAALAGAFAARTQAEWVELGIVHRIPIAPMVRPGALPSVEHWKGRGAFEAFGPRGVAAPTLPYQLRFDGAVQPRWQAEGGDGPLSGLRVIDFSMGWAGPLCARTLADLGADVVKIESEARPDWWRGWEEGLDADARERPLNFINVNRNKRGVDLDLTAPEGLAQARRLLAEADVVVENYAAGVLDKLGLGQAVQRALRPGVISLSMPAFGNGGPLSGIRAYGSTVEQASGLPFVNGEAHWPPSQQHMALGDPIAGLYGASAIVAALYARHRLGGADIDMAQVACLFQLGADAIIAEQVLGEALPRAGRRRARLSACTVVRAAGDEAWLAIAAPDARALARLQAVIGGDHEGKALGDWALRLEPQAAAEILQAAGVPAAPVNPAQRMLGDPQLAACGFFEAMDRPVVGRHLVAACPFRFDGRRPRLRRPAPLLGEHTGEVLARRAEAPDPA